MGLKRPFGDELSELSFKHPRQGENADTHSPYGENVASDDSRQKPDISGTSKFENGFRKPQWSDIHADEIGPELSKCADNDFETSAPFSWITSSSSEDDAGLGPTAYSSISPEYFGFNFPHREVVSFEDIYSSTPRSPRKQVPLGPNHQAIIPVFVGKINKENSDQTGNHSLNLCSSSLETDSTVNGGNEERLMGTCIIPMPDSNLTSDSAGDGRMDCSCLDLGSVRCVRQHVKEAWEKLRDTLGQEDFISLGFCDMGEEVATKWTAEEENTFHEVVYSNPRRNFWMNLSSLFHSRTKGEIVSYYFNVFMLRRRAAQNRSMLDIDSDDDEWHESNPAAYQVRVTADKDFTTELPAFDDEAELVVGSPEEEDDEDTDNDDDDDDDDDDSGNSTGDMGDGRADATEDGGIDYNGRFDSVVPQMDRSPWSYGENFDVQDNSCMSFECQGNTTGGCPVDNAGEVNRLENGKCVLSKVDGLGLIYFLEPCDAKVWDVRHPTKSVDLLPTCNMIDEIFGQGAWNNKKIDG